MELFQIQDEQLKRVLRFFGLRSKVPHDYENVVRPMIQVGDLGMPQSIKTSAGGTVASNIFDCFTTPSDESWRILAMTGTLTQAGGTIAPVYRVVIRDWSSTSLLPMPLYQDGVTTESTQQTGTLNGAVRFTAWLRQPIIVGPNQRITLNTSAGDGTLTVGATILLVNRLGGVLAELD